MCSPLVALKFQIFFLPYSKNIQKWGNKGKVGVYCLATKRTLQNKVFYFFEITFLK
jgi:hypothetical protein